ncbi:hypothetical protein [Pseudomonas sp. NY15354]|uniref:hypothetical protein n=1 Tax=Pseudomonas sp. NY15354 TaxID=3400351 RepID=UPI003A8828D0
MQSRFVIVPAIPKDQDSFRVGVRFYATTVSDGFDIYDNQDKIRIKRGFSSRAAAEQECARMNAESGNPGELFPLPRVE